MAVAERDRNSEILIPDTRSREQPIPPGARPAKREWPWPSGNRTAAALVLKF